MGNEASSENPAESASAEAGGVGEARAHLTAEQRRQGTMSTLTQQQAEQTERVVWAIFSDPDLSESATKSSGQSPSSSSNDLAAMASAKRKEVAATVMRQRKKGIGPKTLDRHIPLPGVLAERFFDIIAIQHGRLASWLSSDANLSRECGDLNAKPAANGDEESSTSRNHQLQASEQIGAHLPTSGDSAQSQQFAQTQSPVLTPEMKTAGIALNSKGPKTSGQGMAPSNASSPSPSLSSLKSLKVSTPSKASPISRARRKLNAVSGMLSSYRSGSGNQYARFASWDDVYSALSILMWGSHYERRAFLFDLFDVTRSGYVTYKELEGVLLSGAIAAISSTASASEQERTMEAARMMAVDCFNVFDPLSNGRVNVEQFSRWLDATPEVELLLFPGLSRDFLVMLGEE